MSVKSTFMSSEDQPGIIPLLPSLCQSRGPTAPLDPILIVPPGPVETLPMIFALPMLNLLAKLELVATSPFDFLFEGS